MNGKITPKPPVQLLGTTSNRKFEYVLSADNRYSSRDNLPSKAIILTDRN